MPFTIVNDPRHTDVFLYEEEDYRSRTLGTVTTTTTTGTYKQGTVVWRAIDVDDTLPWDVVNADADLSLSNEYAIILGTGEKPDEEFTLTNGVATQVLLVRTEAGVKEKPVKDIVTGLGVTAGGWTNLKGLLFKKHNIRVEAETTAL